MEKAIIITDVTRMSESRVCIAGVTEDGATIRPVFANAGIQEDWLYRSGGFIRPFAKIAFDFHHPKPEPPHTEDWVVDPNHRRFLGMAVGTEPLFLLKKTLSPAVAAAFGAEIQHERGFFINLHEGTRSLATVKAAAVDFVRHDCVDGRFRYRISFADQAGAQYELTVTDLTFRYYVDHLRSVENWSCGKIGIHLQQHFNQWHTYLRIGLARAWHPDSDHLHDRHYLQVNGIYTFPDYLYGKCFIDFAPYPKRVVKQEEEVPF